MTDDGKVVKA